MALIDTAARCLQFLGLTPDPHAPPAPHARRRSDRIAAILLALLAFFTFNANLHSIPAADTYAARYLPFSILQNHSVLLNPIASTVAQGRSLPTVPGLGDTAFWIAKGKADHLVSLYPVAVPVVLAPLYIPAVAYLDASGWNPHVFDQVARVMEKLCASLIAATSVALVYLLLRRRCSPRVAALLCAAYAFGTTTWVISSQALWMHGLAQLLVAATMLLITGRSTVLRVVWAGFLCGLIAAVRQPDAVLALALGLYGLRWAGRWVPAFVAAALIPVALTLAYNLVAVGHFSGAYGLLARPDHLNADFLGGVAGLLFSPTRGLFVFSPFLLFVPLFIVRAFREPGQRALAGLIVLAVMAQVAGYALVDWRQGVSWGPRWLTDCLPMLMWLLPPIVTALSRPGRIAWGATCAVAIAIQAVGAFWYTGAVDTAMLTANHSDRYMPMWELGNAAFLAELKHPRAPTDLFRLVQGHIDAVDVVDGDSQSAETGDRISRFIEVAGWALADGRTPADVAVLVNGRAFAGASGFFHRPDVAKTLRTESPAGWLVRFPADRLAAGEHRLTVVVRADVGGEVRLLGERSFTLRADDPAAPEDRVLAKAFGRALWRLEERQQANGSWLTDFTSGTSFTKPQRELNTYVNALMLDIAGPVAKAPPLQQMLTKTKVFLTGQIEPDGLVRYHGRLAPREIGALGCVITPDSDDTALVWRVAPDADRKLLAKALETLGRFQRPDGLYKTWLAERADYKCLDPGLDPNPADIGIQIHILMLLAREDLSAASALCRALTKKMEDTSLWVYYSGAPPMVMLRLADLDKLKCPLQFPASVLRTSAPGQDIWVEAAGLLRQTQGKQVSSETYAAVGKLLLRIAAQDFAMMAVAPPLLYHNDLTATVSRFYWSEDIGYALWLRIYDDYRRLGQTLGNAAAAAAQKGGSR